MTALRALLLALCALLAGCTSREVYDAAGGWRQQECQKLVDEQARARCLESANRDYDTYRKQK